MKFLIIAKQTLTLLFWVILTFGFDTAEMAALTAFAAVAHELGHFIAIYAQRKEKGSLLLTDISGFRIRVPAMSYKEELICAISGPLANLVTAAVVFLFLKGEYARLFCALNIMTAISNLLPIKDYDGYKALLALASLLSKDAARAEAALSALSFLLSAALCFFALYLILKLGEGYWIFFLFFSTLLSEILKTAKTCQNQTNCE